MQRKLLVQPAKTGVSLQAYLQQHLSLLGNLIHVVDKILVNPDETHNCLHLSGVHLG